MRAIRRVDRGRDFDSTNWNLWESVVLLLMLAVVGLLVVERLWVDHLALSRQSGDKSGSATTPASVPTGPMPPVCTAMRTPMTIHSIRISLQFGAMPASRMTVP